jgi:aryl-alcohol dehydrogenase-like predicted oxidoreductase
MEFRTLGKTGAKLSIVGFGGILAAHEEQADANRFVDEALDAGVNYFDVAPTYMDAEDRLGPALAGKRGKIFLACKTEHRTRQAAEDSLKISLAKLQTDHFDLYQFHGVTSLADVDTIFGKDGAMETFQLAKKNGQINHIGFSAHSEEAALKMMKLFDFDSVLYPINWVNLLDGKFSPSVLDAAKKKGMGILALKAMARTRIPEGTENPREKTWYEPIDDKEHAKLAFRFSLAQGITAALPPGYMKWFRWALEVGNNWKEPTPEEVDLLRGFAKGVPPLFPQS